MGKKTDFRRFGFGRFLPILHWGKRYSRDDFGSDLLAGLITAVVLIPQGLAFGLLAGLPPETGLYASLLPPAIYALFGTSRTVSVGPVSVATIMVASALSAPGLAGQGTPLQNALVLTAECGVLLLALSSLRLGNLVTFISHPVLSGFTGGAAVLIIGTQLVGLLGLPRWSCAGGSLPGCAVDLIEKLNPATATLGLLSIAALWLFAGPLVRYLKARGAGSLSVTAMSRSGPLLVVLSTTALVALLGLDHGAKVAVVGNLPAGLPDFSLGVVSGARSSVWLALAPSAFYISLIAYVESVAISKVTAHLRRQTIDANQELVALGAANLAAALTSGMPVAGGLGRTMVNFSAGARTQVATLVTAAMLLPAVLFLTPLLAFIPKAALAAVILVAVYPLLGLKTFITTWRYDRSDAFGHAATFAGVLAFGLEAGLGLGIAISFAGYLWRAGRPHIAVVGRVPGTSHFRSVQRNQVETWPELLMVRVDESLTFANSGFVEDFINAQLRRHPELRHVVLICTAVNHIDTTAFEALERLSDTLKAEGLTLHMAELKEHLLDRLGHTHFGTHLAPGRLFVHTADAVAEIVGVSADEQRVLPLTEPTVSPVALPPGVVVSADDFVPWDTPTDIACETHPRAASPRTAAAA